MKRTILFIAALSFIFSCTQPEKNKNNDHNNKTEKEIKKITYLEKSKVDSVFNKWLKAQNEGVFEDYSSVYANKFTGVKRSGSRTYNFGSEDWLKDRKRMFKKQMIVTADNINIKLFSTSALVQFTQTWQSGKYKDIGPKILFINTEDNKLKISREEMLSSDLLQSKKLNKTTFHFVIENKYIVIDENPEENWSQGKPQIISTQGTKKSVNKNTIPEHYKNWIGKKVRVYDEDGNVHKSTLTDLEIVARAIPHFGMYQQWESDNYTEEQKALELWNLASENAMLVATLADEGKEKYIWAQKLEENQPLIYEIKDYKNIENKIISEFEKLEGYKRIQEDFNSFSEEEEFKGINKWTDFEGYTQNIKYFQHPENNIGYIFMYSRAGYGCGGFYGSLAVIWKVENENLQLISDPYGLEIDMDYIFGVNFNMMIDVENDGNTELIGKERIITIFNEEIETKNILPPYYDCPC